ncbi:MAG: arginase [Burkholderiaceae bacterium]|jgi:arginase|nr:arginase [Burkholderiales bacterium]MCZ8339776.1 arginase [Burkholderiaceae bacterium]
MSDTLRPIELVGAAIGEGAPDRRTRAGPGSLRQWGLGARLQARGRGVRWGPIVQSDLALLPQGPMAVVAEFSGRLARAVGAALDAGRLPVVVGGDHSCAIGTWSAAAAALRRGGEARRLGLVWIDAHLDAHTPETSETQMPHGMPIASLLGHGAPALTTVADAWPKLRPQDLVLIGPRSWESGEAALLARLGVRVIAGDEVARRGFADCMREAVERVSADTAGWGVSFDLDALDPLDAPGTGVPVPGGLRVAEVSAALRGLACDERVVAVELVEYNPTLDVARTTAAATDRVLGAIVDRRDPAAGPCPGPQPRAKARP